MYVVVVACVCTYILLDRVYYVPVFSLSVRPFVGRGREGEREREREREREYLKWPT